ncbi:hypothetical protein GGR57DRAFT_470563 [Xylariaceae sp. FL1272]|nr:hypothetical protein GGR57DRAFT_470563 [Xylariaceae sp. FL1272]
MAELAAIGLASNIIQFVELGTKLAIEVHELYTSRTGATALNAGREHDTKTFISLVENVRSSASRQGTAVRETQAEGQLRSLADTCNDVSQQLLSVLDKSKIDPANRNLLKAFKKAVTGPSTRGKIDQLQNRLDRLGNQTMLCFVVLLQEDHAKHSKMMRDLDASNASLEANTTQHMDLVQKEMGKISQAIPRETAVMALTDPGVFSSIVPHLQKLHINDQLLGYQQEMLNAQKQQLLLKSLRFSEIGTRHKSIEPAHQETFKWIFDRCRHSFRDWLETGKGIYWIKGRAGSGKSTLMRFIVEHELTDFALSKWAGKRKLVIASHFFWISGSSLQKSQEGLLRTIAFQIFRRLPDLLMTLFPKRWANPDPEFDPWSADELTGALTKLSLDLDVPYRFCFFIDGLDEYTTGMQRYHGDFEELINLIHSLSKTSVIKICVSSKPWTAFERAFGDTPNSLLLEELTKHDIKKYVLDKFKANSHYQNLEATRWEREKLQKDIVDKAGGVFLWVSSVADSLLKGAAACDNIRELQRRLDRTPVELEGLFKQILQTIEPVYLEETVRILQVAVHAEGPLPLVLYHCLEQGRYAPDSALIIPISNIDIPKMEANMKVRLNARCKDFLHVQQHIGPYKFSDFVPTTLEVDFLHGSVRDFFIEDHFLPHVSKQHGFDFDVHVSLCRLMLSWLDIITSAEIPEIRTGRLESWFRYVYIEQFSDVVRVLKKYFRFARYIEMEIAGYPAAPISIGQKNKIMMYHTLLDEGERICAPWLDRANEHCKHDGLVDLKANGILAGAVANDLRIYVAKILDSQPDILDDNKGRPLLAYALEAIGCTTIINDYWHWRREDARGPMMVDILLSRGADPNRSFLKGGGKTSPWMEYLRNVPRFPIEMFDYPIVYETMYSMISYGAQLNNGYIIQQDGSLNADFLGTKAKISEEQIRSLEVLIRQKKLDAKEAEKKKVEPPPLASAESPAPFSLLARIRNSFW